MSSPIPNTTSSTSSPSLTTPPSGPQKKGHIPVKSTIKRAPVQPLDLYKKVFKQHPVPSTPTPPLSPPAHQRIKKSTQQNTPTPEKPSRRHSLQYLQTLNSPTEAEKIKGKPRHTYYSKEAAYLIDQVTKNNSKIFKFLKLDDLDDDDTTLKINELIVNRIVGDNGYAGIEVINTENGHYIQMQIHKGVDTDGKKFAAWYPTEGTGVITTDGDTLFESVNDFITSPTAGPNKKTIHERVQTRAAARASKDPLPRPTFMDDL